MLDVRTPIFFVYLPHSHHSPSIVRPLPPILSPLDSDRTILPLTQAPSATIPPLLTLPHRSRHRAPEDTHRPVLMRLSSLLGLAPFIASALAAPYNETYAEYNLNTNQNAQSPLDYDTSFVPSKYHPSPDNWRIPYYTILMDKFADGDPTNNDFFETEFEWDWRETNFRFGGDLAGLESKLDYLAGMGIKAIFASGTPWINMLWQADSASPPCSHCLSRVLTSLASFFLSSRIVWLFLDASCAGDRILLRTHLQAIRPSTSPLSIRTGVDAMNGAR